MPDHTLAIVFRNPHPQRTPMRAKLYLLRGDGSSVHIDYPDQGRLHQAEPIAPRRRMRRTGVTTSSAGEL